jgi:hypothetical protein
MLKGWRTMLLATALTFLGVLEGAQVTTLVQDYPGAFATTVGVVIAALRWATTTPVFKAGS